VLARVAASTRPTACVIGFDDPFRSTRRELHPAYKAQRPPKPTGLVNFLDDLPGLLRRIGFHVVVPQGLEADDVLGSAAEFATRRGVPATLVTGDRDSFALVRPTVNVWLLGSGGATNRVAPSYLASRYGVGPEAYPDFAAMRGDASDNLPGVKGIGAMTAARLLAAYPDAEAAFADPAGVTRLLGPYLGRTLLDQRAVFEHNREIMRIRTDVPIDADACARPLERPPLSVAFADLGLDDLTDRVLGSFRALGRAAWRCPPPAADC
jgi:DNA polymerase-1